MLNLEEYISHFQLTLRLQLCLLAITTDPYLKLSRFQYGFQRSMDFFLSKFGCNRRPALVATFTSDSVMIHSLSSAVLPATLHQSLIIPGLPIDQEVDQLHIT